MGQKQETIEQLQERHATFNKQQIRVQAQLEEAQKRLAELNQRAKAEFGTDDVEQLREKLETMKRENEQKRAEYQSSLDQIDAKLKEVETEFAEASVE
jgi:predicted  nucleic acid-binding Zn-ribbon protein